MALLEHEVEQQKRAQLRAEEDVEAAAERAAAAERGKLRKALREISPEFDAILGERDDARRFKSQVTKIRYLNGELTECREQNVELKDLLSVVKKAMKKESEARQSLE